MGNHRATFIGSNRLQIGDWILTLGSPLDLRQTVSGGTEQAATSAKVASEDLMLDDDPTEVVCSGDLQIAVAPAAKPAAFAQGIAAGGGIRVLRAEPAGPAFRAGKKHQTPRYILPLEDVLPVVSIA